MKQMKNDRVYVFLVGLNKDLYKSRKSLSSIREVFAEVQREQAQWKVMLNGEPRLNIGDPRQGVGIYFFEDGSNVKGQPESTCFKSISSISDNEILLWYFRLGHLSFWYSKYLFSKLFLNKNISSFQCEIYELAKHHHVSCPS